MDDGYLGRAIRPLYTVCYVIRMVEGRSEYLLLRRLGAYHDGNWQMVSGNIEGDETAWQAALRELHEETGLKPARFYSADQMEIFYEVMQDRVMIAPIFVAFVEPNQDVILSSQEHDQFVWEPYANVRGYLKFSNQHRNLEHIEEYYVQNKPFSFFEIPLREVPACP